MLIILLLFIICAPNLYAQPSSPVSKSILATLDFDESFKIIKEIKSNRDIKKYNMVNYKNKNFLAQLEFWNEINIDKFELGLITLLNNIEQEQIEEIAEKLKNPFIVKMIRSLTVRSDVFTLYDQLIKNKHIINAVPKGHNSHIKALSSLIGTNAFLQRIRLVFSDIKKDNKENSIYINHDKGAYGNFEPEQYAQKIEKFEIIFLNNLYDSLKKYSIYELNEFIRLMNSDKVMLKSLNLIVNYYRMVLFQSWYRGVSVQIITTSIAQS